MESLKNKSLSELFAIGIKLKKPQQQIFLESVKQFSPQYSQELKKMFASNPSQMGLSGAIVGIKQTQQDIDAMQMPKKIGQFTITNILGFGGMGMVFLGKREDINQIVAVKVAHSSRPDSTKTQAITSEAKILASLQHPNIASLVDWGEYENGYYIATEFVKGKTIANHCNEQKLTVIQRISLFIKIIDAVEFAHDNLIIHRDIKPNNIMVDESGEPILIDFGVARLMESETAEHQQTQNAALTPSFASPEQRTGKNLSIRSDIYSLGAVLLNLITDKQIDNQTDQSVLPIIENLIEKDHKNNKSSWHKLSRQMQKDLSLILAKSLSFDAKQRYANAFSFKQDLQSLLTLKPIAAHEPSRWYWFKKFIARNKLVTSILTVALMATVFGGWQWYQTQLGKEKAEELSKDMFNYSKFLEKTLIGMNAYEGGSANITMDAFMQRAVEVFKKEESVSPKQLSYHAHILSKIYNSWGKMEESIAVLNIGLDYAKKSKSPAHIATTLGQKAVIYYNQAKYNECIDTIKEALLISKNHPKATTQKAANSIQLSLCYTAIGKYDESIEISKNIINNKNNSKLNIAYANYAIADIKGTIYQFEDSIKYYKKAEPLFIELFGENSGMVIATRAMKLYLQAQIDPQSFDINQQKNINQVAIKTLGENNPNIAFYKEMLINTYFLKNKLSKSIELQQQVIPALEASNLIPQAIASKIRLVDYYLLNNEEIKAKKVFITIEETSLDNLLDSVIIAMYYKNLARLAMISKDFLSAKESLYKTKELLKDSKNIDALIPLYFREAQLAALEKDYQSCFENAQKATEMAEDLYPKTWQLPNAYRYLQNVCKQKLDGIENNSFPYLQAVLDSPWKQETVITTKILNQN